MPASPLPRTARARTGAAALTALTLAGATLLGAPAAFAAPGDNGDVKVHSEKTSPTDQRNESKACKFYLTAFDFEDVLRIDWVIEPQPMNSASSTLNGTISLKDGTGYTDTQALPDGEYKLTWKILGGTGPGKEKRFTIDCRPAAPAPAAAPAAPRGAVPAGGGGLAEAPSVSALAAAGAVGLVGVSGFVYFRMLRRRPDGAA